ncbi:MAG: aminodeoxychorismate lyase [Gammaproteobacteria bacterium]|nr:aminodeoxychorismate lyase [Gammaproteobacteria bacterium]
MLINGSATTMLDARDRGLHYGDGLFETIAVRDGAPALWDAHMRRLALGCQRLALPPVDAPLLADEAMRLCGGVERGVLKIIITRGSGGRGYRAPAMNAMRPTRIVALHSWPDYPDIFWTEGVSVRICATRLGHNSLLAGIKHLNRLEQVLARSEWDDPGVAEGLMLDQNGNVIEGTMTNLFIVRDGRLRTPDVSRCGVAGVMRRRVLDAARESGVACEVGTVTPEDVKFAEEVFLCNSLIGVWPVREIEGKRFEVDGMVTRYIVSKLR